MKISMIGMKILKRISKNVLLILSLILSRLRFELMNVRWFYGRARKRGYINACIVTK